MKIVFQIFTGDLTENSLAQADDMIEKLSLAHDSGQLGGVLCGWSTDRAFYERLAETLQRWGVDFYLKLAAFSELNQYAEHFDPIIDYRGHLADGYVLNLQETFEFRCPSSRRNRQLLVDLFDEMFAGIPFTGIFLDRIRYSSFLSGMAGTGCCFCPDCVRRYRQMGLPVDQIRQHLMAVEEKKDMSFSAYQAGVWKLQDPLLDAFYQAKCRIVEEAVTELAEAFRARGLRVGLDLFAPAVGYFCGQDVQRLRQVVDFVKPMLYRYTEAPAGIPFERERLIAAAGSVAGAQFDALTGGVGTHFADFMKRELTWLRQEMGCPVWPGIEANYVEPIALITPQQIRENKQLLQSLGYEKMVASWNLAKIPAENMKALLE